MFIKITRWLLTTILLLGVWHETGLWTASAFFLVLISIELICNTIKIHLDLISEINRKHFKESVDKINQSVFGNN